MTHTLGFLGTGTITAAIVRGLKGSALKDWPVILSPRNTALSAELAASLPGVAVASSNQEVIDHSEIVFLAMRPQDAEAVIRPLAFRPGQRIITLVAALDVATIRAWTGVSSITRAIPLTFVEHRAGVTPIMPPDETAAKIFSALGTCIQVSDIDAFDGYAAASALMGTYFGVAEVAQGWLVANGLKPEDSELFLRHMFGSLGDVMRAKPLSLEELRAAHSTRGGLNELAYERFMGAGGGEALKTGLDAVLERIHAQRPPNT